MLGKIKKLTSIGHFSPSQVRSTASVDLAKGTVTNKATTSKNETSNGKNPIVWHWFFLGPNAVRRELFEEVSFWE